MPVFPNREIFEEVARLEFPTPSEVIITHSSALFARGIDMGREMGDIDLVVSPDNMRHLIVSLGWTATGQRKYYDEDLPDKIRYTLSHDERVDAFAHDFIPEQFRKTGRGRIYPHRLIDMHNPRYDQDDETGLYVASKTHVIASKFGTNRSKDADDIRRVIQHDTFGY